LERRTCVSLKKLVELLDGDLDGADDTSKSSAVDFVVHGYRDGRTLWTNEPYVAAFLTKDGVAELGQGSDAGGPGNDWKRRHDQAARMLMSTTS
jgi:hypothetical protein